MTGTNNIGDFFVGCPIWAFKGWVANFFPAGTKSTDFLREYARRLTTVEGNTTFYAVPSAATIERWRDASNTHLVITRPHRGDRGYSPMDVVRASTAKLLPCADLVQPVVTG